MKPILDAPNVSENPCTFSHDPSQRHIICKSMNCDIWRERLAVDYGLQVYSCSAQLCPGNRLGKFYYHRPIFSRWARFN